MCCKLASIWMIKCEGDAKTKVHQDPHLLYPLDISSEYVAGFVNAEPEMQISTIS